MTIKQHGGVFGRNPSFNDASVETLSIGGTAISSTAAELNILDGVTADSTELNYLDGASTSVVTASKAVLANASANIAFASGKGIDFSATAGTGTSELLDDYEEGTWTPAYSCATTEPTITYDTTATKGSYVKVGQLVFLTGSIMTDSISGGSGNVRLAGLPFTVANNGQADRGGTFSIGQAQSFLGDTPSFGNTVENTNVVNLYYRSASNGATTLLDISDLNTGANDNLMRFGLVYRSS